MEELYDEVHVTAVKHFCDYIKKCSSESSFVLQMCLQMVLFSKHEPKLYQFIFMQHNKQIKSLDDMLAQLGITANMCISAICNDYGLSPANAKTLFQHIWIYTFSLGTLCATKVCDFSEEELTQMLSMQIKAIVSFIKTEECKQA